MGVVGGGGLFHNEKNIVKRVIIIRERKSKFKSHKLYVGLIININITYLLIYTLTPIWSLIDVNL